MALDVALLGEDGEPEVAVAIGVDAHVRLMRVAREAGLELLQRMSDYYEDAEFDAGEVAALTAELDCADSRVLDDELRNVLSAIRKLVERASRAKRGLVAIAD
jgi:hypothetical protein